MPLAADLMEEIEAHLPITEMNFSWRADNVVSRCI